MDEYDINNKQHCSFSVERHHQVNFFLLDQIPNDVPMSLSCTRFSASVGSLTCSTNMTAIMNLIFTKHQHVSFVIVSMR